MSSYLHYPVLKLVSLKKALMSVHDHQQELRTCAREEHKLDLILPELATIPLSEHARGPEHSFLRNKAIPTVSHSIEAIFSANFY